MANSEGGDADEVREIRTDRRRHYMWIEIWGGPTTARATVIGVPGDQPSIQAGISAASQGDTVLVGQGIYQENVNFRGKDIVVASHYLLGGDYADVRATVIDGSLPADPDTGSCVVFCGGESEAACLQGFTIRGGSGTRWVDPQYPTYTWRGGGGIFTFGASPTIKNNLITGNTVANNGTVDGAQGGGMTCFQGDPVIVNNTIRDNQADYGAGLVVDYSGARIRNNLIVGNHGGTVYGGGGIWTIGTWPAPILLENNTIADNHSQLYGGALYVWSSVVTLHNNIIWGNTQGAGTTIWIVGGGSVSATYCDIEGGQAGEGNLDLDPLFADPANYVLDPGSPCVDTGDPGAAYFDPEDPGSPGQAQWPAHGTLRNDMGAYGGPGCGSFEPDASDIEPGTDPRPRGQLPTPRCIPSPFSDETAICFEFGASAPVRVQIYDVTGALVRELAAGTLTPGAQALTWDGRDECGRPVSGGAYLYRLTDGAGDRTGLAILLR